MIITIIDRVKYVDVIRKVWGYVSFGERKMVVPIIYRGSS